MGNGHAWTISTLVPAKVFKSDFSLLRCAATPRNAATKLGRKLHRWLEGIEKGGKRKTDFSYLIFPFSGDLELTLSENRASKWSNKRWNLDGTVLTPAFLLYSGRSTQLNTNVRLNWSSISFVWYLEVFINPCCELSFSVGASLLTSNSLKTRSLCFEHFSCFNFARLLVVTNFDKVKWSVK